MSIEKVRLAAGLLIRTPETQKDYSLVDMANVLRASPFVDTVEHYESDRGEVRDIRSKIFFGDLTLGFKITATEKYFALSGILVNYKGRLIEGGWSALYESFILDIDEKDKKVIHNFLLAVTKVL